MSFANILLLAALQVATIASAQTHRLFPGMHVESIGELIPRRLFDNASECTIRDTCGECFGFGYVLCDKSGCFNPDDGEQCCKGGYMCVGRDDSCCLNGPGEPGEDGTITYPSDTSLEEDEGEDEYTSWTCDTTMTGEECCSGGGPDIHWCTGEYPSVTCYNSTRETCCEDGHFCEGEDCCDIVDSTPTTPWLTGVEATSTSTSGPKSSSDSADEDSEDGTASGSAASASITSDESSPTPTDAGEKLAITGRVAVLGAVAAGLLVL
ncbi:hypothetical protein BDW60DRAFT_202672 [Aspergillus nidulans var. acristatus]